MVRFWWPAVPCDLCLLVVHGTCLIPSALPHPCPPAAEALPSCAFFTFFNTAQSLNCVAFTSDASIVAGAWRLCRAAAGMQLHAMSGCPGVLLMHHHGAMDIQQACPGGCTCGARSGCCPTQLLNYTS